MASADDKFSDTVDKLKDATEQLEKAAKNMSGGGKKKGGSAAAEKARDQEKRENQTNNYLKEIVGLLGKGGASLSDKEKKGGGIFAGIARALGGVGAGIGKAVGGFMGGIAGAALKGPAFVLAMGFLGAGIAAFMAAIAGGAWLASKTFPDIAESLKAFDKVDGKNLKEVGLGMAALGVGLGAQGLGGAIGAVGNLVGSIADGIGGLFGAKSGDEALMEKLEKFGKVKVNKENIENNAAAMMAYGKAMAVGGGSKILGALGTLADGVFGSIGKALGGIPPMESLVKFSQVDIDGDKVKKNADAMMQYAKAMTLGAAAKGMEALGSLGNVVTSVADGISKMVGGKGTLDSQIEGMQKLSAATGIDKDKIKEVAKAMVFYAAAMIAGAPASLAQGGASLGNLVTSIGDGLSKLIGGKGTLDNQLDGLKKMSLAGKVVDAKNVEKVATAMVSYAKAMALGAAGSTVGAIGAIGNFVGGAVKALGNFFGIKDRDPLGELKKFSEFIITDTQIAQIILNARAVSAYANAMGALGKVKLPGNFSDTISSIMDGIGGFFSKKKDPLAALENFSKKSINAQNVKSNVDALNEFAKLGQGVSGRLKIEEFVEGIVKALPALEMAIMGGKVEGSILPSWMGGSKSTILKGLADTTIDYAAARKNMNMLKQTLSEDVAMINEEAEKTAPAGGSKLSGSTQSADLDGATQKANVVWQSALQKSIDNLSAVISAAGGGGQNIAVRQGDVVNAPKTNMTIQRGSARDSSWEF